MTWSKAVEEMSRQRTMAFVCHVAACLLFTLAATSSQSRQAENDPLRTLNCLDDVGEIQDMTRVSPPESWGK